MTSTVVLASGLGTRLRTASGDVPKPLVEIEGRSVIARNLAWLGEAGVGSALVTLHYQPERFRALLGGGRDVGLALEYLHETQLIGTAGALKGIVDTLSWPVLVVYGDSLVRFDLQAFRAAHARSGATASIALFDPNRHPHTGIAGGRAVLDDDGRIVGFQEGGAGGGYVNAGVYLLEREAIDEVPDDAFCDFGRHLFPRLLERGRHLHGHVFEDAGYCLGLDTPECLDVTRALVAGGRVQLA